MLRSIYLSSKYGNMVEEMKEDSEKMGTSTSVIQSNYVKHWKIETSTINYEKWVKRVQKQNFFLYRLLGFEKSFEKSFINAWNKSCFNLQEYVERFNLSD